MGIKKMSKVDKKEKKGPKVDKAAEKAAALEAERLAAEQEEAKKAQEAAAKAAKGKGKGKGKEEVKEPAKEPAKEPEAEKEPVETKGGKNMSLNTITKAIVKQIEIGSKTTLKMGELLFIAREQHFTKAVKGGAGKVDGKKFLAWAEENFSIKKAYAYNLIKVYNVFRNMPDFHDVPYMVLINLTTDEDMLNAACQALDEGVTVDTVWLKDFLAERKAAEKQARKDAGEDEPDDEGDDDGEEEEGSSSKADKKAKQDEMDDKLIAGLEAQIAELQERLSQQPDMEKLAKRMKGQEAYQVLGVAPDADKRAINKAHRDLKVIFGVVPAVMELVDAAKEAMDK